MHQNLAFGLCLFVYAVYITATITWSYIILKEGYNRIGSSTAIYIFTLVQATITYICYLSMFALGVYLLTKGLTFSGLVFFVCPVLEFIFGKLYWREDRLKHHPFIDLLQSGIAAFFILGLPFYIYLH